MVFVIACTWTLMFGASHAWEFVEAGIITIVCVCALLRSANKTP